MGESYPSADMQLVYSAAPVDRAIFRYDAYHISGPVLTKWLLLKYLFMTSVSIIGTQRAFCAHSMLHQNDAVPDWKLILLPVENFRTTS